MKKTLITISGPTASGKTKLSIELANKLNCEIISFDSRQFYKEMSIGTAVPSKKELSVIKHHLIQHVSIKRNYTIKDFELDATKIIENQFQIKNYIILVGGSFLYLDSITKGLDFIPSTKPVVRENLNVEFQKLGIDFLKNKLKILDPTYYEKVDKNNHRRLIRALEVSISSGKPYSSFLGKMKKEHPFDIINLRLDVNRNCLFERIDNRVNQMINSGLADEVKNLLKFKGLNPLNAIGYKELFHFFEGKKSFDDCVNEIKKNTRRYAKRQITWLNSKENLIRVKQNSKVDDVINQIELK